MKKPKFSLGLLLIIQAVAAAVIYIGSVKTPPKLTGIAGVMAEWLANLLFGSPVGS